MTALRTLALAALLAACAAEPRSTLAAPGGPARQGPWSFELVDEWGAALPTFSHLGRTYILGEPGQRYLIRVHNGSGRRVEVVASVDGLDVVDGRRASFDRRGYLVEPWGDVTIEGFRLSQADVAAFRFGSVGRSYAASKGDTRDVGVVGVAIFPERAPAWPPPYRPQPWPYPGSRDDEERAEGRAGAPSSSAPEQGRKSSAAEAPSARADANRSRPGLGTEFGERHGSAVEEVAFERASSSPAAVLTLRYDDRRGLVAAGVDLDRWAWGRADDQWMREHANPFRGSAPYSEPPPGWRGY